ncbi:MAG: RDD family protein [Thaumarchaeota archaeon]|nr:RDD family protein [Nitrososphaerota archaeon]
MAKDQAVQQLWVKRFAALIIDGILVYVVLYIIALFALSSFLLGGVFGYGLFFGGFIFLFGFLFLLYFAFMESSRGATIGKGVMGLKVVSKSGGKPNITEAFIRNISKIYWLLLLLDIIGGLAMSKGARQKYTDTMAGTTVVSK